MGIIGIRLITIIRKTIPNESNRHTNKTNCFENILRNGKLRNLIDALFIIKNSIADCIVVPIITPEIQCDTLGRY